MAKARLDLAAAKLLLEPGTGEPITEVALFHLQQAAEKLLKAMLSKRGVHYPKTHDIENLLLLCRQNGIALPDNADSIMDLSDYAVEGRYEMMAEPMTDISGYFELVLSLQRFVDTNDH